MSSLVDAVLNSDNLDLDLAAAAAPSDGPTPAPHHVRTPRSSSRLGGPPSESHGHPSDDEGGFPDDEVVGIRGNVKNRFRDPFGNAVPKVVDQVGETVQQNFEEFLET